MRLFLISLTLITFIHISVSGQLVLGPEIPDELVNNVWPSSWVAVPGASDFDFGVYLFRNELDIEELPESYIIHVSADNRYKLYINGNIIGLGPARSDTRNWYYESYDIASFLKSGKNIVAAEVWNFGAYKPNAQLSYKSGFIVQENDLESTLLNTPGTWQCMQTDAITPVPHMHSESGTFAYTGPGEKVDGTRYPWEWVSPEYSDGTWPQVRTLYPGYPFGVGTTIRYGLKPRNIPAMELQAYKHPIIRKLNETYLPASRKDMINDLRIPANSNFSILLDQEELITAYPELTLSGGLDSKIKLIYAEALFDENGKKQHRDSIRKLNIQGISDEIVADGATLRKYSPMWFRSFRYLQLDIRTGKEDLIIHSLLPFRTGYPFKEQAYFNSDNKVLSKIWEVGWRTSVACANELYFDCPSYEQMQYVGDTRIQALISLYVSGDDRLMRKAIQDFYHSMEPEGITQSSYPAELSQIIPPYSLYWISMIHDYLWHRNDYLFAAEYLVSIQHILRWFENRIDPESKMLGAVEYWPFVDWSKEWPWDDEKHIGGMPPGAQKGNSSVLTLHYAMTLKQAADIFGFFGLDGLSDDYARQANDLIQATKMNCWDKDRGLFADTPEKTSYSQHANTFAVLADAIKKEEEALFVEQLIRDTTLVQASLYFSFYLNRAAVKAGLGNKYLSYLGPWKKMTEHGLSTFPEIADLENTRSDCHAWSSSPLYELISTVAGIRPASVGFENVIIEPHPGNLKWIKAGMPHHYGEITLDLSFNNKGGVSGTVHIPAGLKGILLWDSQTLDLKPGKQKVSLNSFDSRFRMKVQD